MSLGVINPLSRTPTKTHRRCFSSAQPRANGFFKIQFQDNFPRFHFTCKSTGGDNNESRMILDAFFLGKAVAEAVNERVESAVGEFLSTVGRLQAEQQKQVQEFQEEVLEKARRAKEQASREALEAQGIASTSTASDVTRVNNNGFTSTSSSASNSITIESSSVSKPINGDLLSGMLNDD